MAKVRRKSRDEIAREIVRELLEKHLRKNDPEMSDDDVERILEIADLLADMDKPLKSSVRRQLPYIRTLAETYRSRRP